MKFRNLLLFYTFLINFNLFYKPSVFAQVCTFDSYIIINGNCVDVSNPNRSTIQHQEEQEREDNIIYYPDSSSPIQKNNRIECDNFPSDIYGFLSKDDWNYLKDKYFLYNKPLSLHQESPLSLYEIQSILGFSGKNIKQSGRTSSYIWMDKCNNRKIEANFVDYLIINLKGTGFKD